MSLPKLNSQARHQYRVLLIAEAANPEWTSVPLVGWSLSRALAKVVDAHLVTHIRNRDAIIRAGLVEGRDFTAIDNERVAAPLLTLAHRLRGGVGKGWTTNTAFSSLAYYSFELELWRQFKTRFAAHEFDLVHRITPLSPTSQSILARRLASLNIPFVVGPLNGGVPWPKHFIGRQYAEHDWLSHVRWVYKFMPGYRSTRRYSAAIIVGSKHTYREMPDWAKEKCVYIPENGVSVDCLEFARDRSACLPLHGAFVGRLVPYKGADILLEATADFLRKGQLKLHIIGDGPQRPLLEAMVERLGIQSNVRLYVWISHVEVENRLRTCDFLALPSVREFGGGVVVESMALGVTPIVADYAGPSELVDDNTGIRVPFHDKESLLEGMRLAIENIIRTPETSDKLGAAARQKVRETLTWEAKANQITAIYDAVLSGATSLPFSGLIDERASEDASATSNPSV
jgi:glycosyltransferase involved in cell wall biosynthesis